MSPFIYFPLLCQLLLVAWVDLQKKKISNYWPIANMVLALGLYFMLPQFYPFSWELFLFPLGFIILGFFFFLMGIMGAGDSKYLASLFLVTPVDYHLPFFDKLLMSTMVVGGILLTWKLIKNYSRLKAYVLSQYWQGLKDVIKSKFSYAPVILLAWILLGIQK